MLNGIAIQVQRLWRASRPLTAVGLGMLVVFAFSVAGVALDPRTITGAPAWLKPAKFAISTAIYAVTVAWLFTYLPDRPRLVRRVGWTTAAVLVLEVAIIDAQAARGVTSHFNVATPVDAALFAVMGVAIVIAWAVAVALSIALFRQRFADGAMGSAIRIGMLTTVVGSAAGGLMTSPTGAQLAAAHETHRLVIAGAHTVGAADGGPGMPGTGWSREHGDLRVPHFVGLHGVQILPGIAWLIAGLSAVRRRRLVVVAGVSYGSLFLVLLAQALAGQPVLAPHGLPGAALATWLVATAAATLLARSARRPDVAHDAAAPLAVS